jgi:hypothetical protein
MALSKCSHRHKDDHFQVHVPNEGKSGAWDTGIAITGPAKPPPNSIGSDKFVFAVSKDKI